MKVSARMFAKHLKKYDVISLDVFDTLIFRDFVIPNEVFREVAEKLEYPEFYQLRCELEKKAREVYRKQKKSNEVTFQEIYKWMEEKNGISVKKAMQTEIETEFQHCFANPYMQEVVKELRILRKRIVITSDMYLGKELIRELLLYTGYGEFDAYYVSCDYRKSKADGKLYDVVKQKETGAKIVHIGDNWKSDVVQAKIHGIMAFHYKREGRY